MSQVLELTKELIRRESLTPNDAGCQKYLADRLAKCGFNIEPMRFGEVDNLWARYGTKAPLIVFAGHTDVVPTGPHAAWQSPPFQPTEREGYLYGRGAADMKSGLAAMIIAAENFLAAHKTFEGSIGFLITSDEEGPSIDGTKKVIECLEARNEKIDYCIIGEASSERSLGDQIRVGRRGSLSGKLRVIGKQGHVAFPHHARNPIHLLAPVLHALTCEVWDTGNESFPPTSFQISNIHSGTGALNVIPGECEIDFNFRFSTAVTAEQLMQRVETICDQHSLSYKLDWNYSAKPFLSKQGKMIAATIEAIQKTTQLTPVLSTGGGTSDGRFIAPTGAEVIELGPCNASVHQVDEHVKMADLETLSEIYQEILNRVME